MDEECTPSTETTGDDVNVGDILDQLDQLEDTITTDDQHKEFQETKQMLKRLPGSDSLEERITKYTTRDIGEATVGSIVFALPLLVEDGVFEIAESFFDFLIAGIPVMLVANVLFVFALTYGLIYGVDYRDVHINNPILGFLPRRLVGILVASFVTTALLMLMWGRLLADDPTQWEMFARITVIWAAAALGASLGDILPGESKGTDLTLDNLDNFVGDN